MSQQILPLQAGSFLRQNYRAQKEMEIRIHTPTPPTTAVSSPSCISTVISTTTCFSAPYQQNSEISHKKIDKNSSVFKIIPKEPIGQRSGNQDNGSTMTMGYA